MKYPLQYFHSDKEAFGIKKKLFYIPFRGRTLQVFASIYDHGWEHVSVSLQNRNPNWDEMCLVKDLFFDDEEICIQYHPKKSEYVNLHKYCLHIWKPPIDKIALLEEHRLDIKVENDNV